MATSILLMTFGKRLRVLRQKRGWPQKYLEEYTGLGRKSIGRLENGKQNPCLDTLQILAKCFDMTISEFLKGIG